MCAGRPEHGGCLASPSTVAAWPGVAGKEGWLQATLVHAQPRWEQRSQARRPQRGLASHTHSSHFNVLPQMLPYLVSHGRDLVRWLLSCPCYGGGN